MIHMIGEVLGLHEPQFFGPGYRPGYYTTALTPLHTGTGRTRLVSNLVAELKAPRHFFPSLPFPFLRPPRGVNHNSLRNVMD